MIYNTLWIPAAIAGGVALASAISSNIAAKKRAKAQREHEAEQQRLAQEYNDPSAQMERLKTAGLNPHLVYGGSPSQVAGEFVEQPGKGVGEEYQPINFSEITNSAFGQHIGISTAKAGINKAEAETEAINQRKQIEFAEWEAKNPYLKDNAKNTARQIQAQSFKSFMEADILDQRKGALENDPIVVDGQKISNVGQLQNQQAISKIRSESEARKLIKAQTTNQHAQNKAIKEFEKAINQLLGQGLSWSQALKSAAYYALSQKGIN